MDFANLILELGARFGLPEPLQPDQNGVCEVTIDDRISVCFEVLPEMGLLFVYWATGPLRDDLASRDELYPQLLNDNGYVVQPPHGKFSVNVETREVVLMQRIPLSGANTNDVFSLVMAFVRHAEQWFDRIAAHLEAGNPAAK